MPGLDRLLQYVLCTDRFNPSSTKRQQRQKLTQPTYVKVNFNDASGKVGRSPSDCTRNESRSKE